MAKPIKDKKDVVNAISVGVTWVDGRIIFKQEKKFGKFYYGVCHYSKGVFAITPLDYDKPLMINTIIVDHIEKYCDRAYTCMNLSCKLNRFNLESFLAEFAGMGEFTLALPKDFGKSEDKKSIHNWFNEGKWAEVWKDFIIGIEGGVLRFSEEKAMLSKDSPIIIP